jgi:hypothetical protein
MSAAEIIAEIKALPSRDRERVFEFLVSDKDLREDLEDSLLLESRRDEPSRALEDALRKQTEVRLATSRIQKRKLPRSSA